MSYFLTRLKVKDFAVGDKVSVSVPYHERTSTDLRRLPGIVTAVKGDRVKMYVVGTKFGILQSKLRAGDLQSYNGDVTCHTNRLEELTGVCLNKHKSGTVLQVGHIVNLQTSNIYLQLSLTFTHV